MDVASDPKLVRRLAAHLRKRGIALHRISAVTGHGVPALVEQMWRGLRPAGTDA
jgi:uncharacterized metal-binding protein